MGLLDILKNILGMGRTGTVPPVTRPSTLVETLLLLESTDKEFSKRFPALLNFNEKVRDIFLYLAYMMSRVLRTLGLGDEYGIYYHIVERLLNPTLNIQQYERFRRSVTRVERFIYLPYYVVYMSFNAPLKVVQASTLFTDIKVVPVFRVMEASKSMAIPFVFIAKMRNLVIMPEPVRWQAYLQAQSIIRLPGPRLYYMIERCITCEKTEESATGERMVCRCLVEDGTCYEPTEIETSRREEELPSKEIIYVEKVVEKKGKYVDRKILVSFAYNMASLIADEDIYLAWGYTV